MATIWDYEIVTYRLLNIDFCQKTFFWWPWFQFFVMNGSIYCPFDVISSAFESSRLELWFTIIEIIWISQNNWFVIDCFFFSSQQIIHQATEMTSILQPAQTGPREAKMSQWASRINLWGQKWYPCIDDNVDNKIDIIIDVMDNNVDTNNIDIDTIDINIDVNINDTNYIDIYIKSINLSNFDNFKIFNFRWKLCSFQSWSKLHAHELIFCMHTCFRPKLSDGIIRNYWKF